MLATAGVFLILTGLGVGAGGLFGLQMAARLNALAAPESKTEPPPSQTVKSRYPANVNVRALPAIITNLAAPERTWVRLEVALVMDNEQSPEASALAAAISEDIVAFLRTLSLRQIEGASGFQHLREDLADRVRVRGGGKARDLIIQTLVVE